MRFKLTCVTPIIFFTLACVSSSSALSGESKSGFEVRTVKLERSFCQTARWEDYREKREEEVEAGNFQGMTDLDASSDSYPVDPSLDRNASNQSMRPWDDYLADQETDCMSFDFRIDESDLQSDLERWKSQAQVSDCTQQVMADETEMRAGAVCDSGAYTYVATMFANDRAQLYLRFDQARDDQICGTLLTMSYKQIAEEACVIDHSEEERSATEPPQCSRIREELAIIERRCEEGALAYCREVGLTIAQLNLAGCN